MNTYFMEKVMFSGSLVDIILINILLVFLGLALRFVYTGLKMAHRKRKIDVDAIRQSSSGFLVTHGMVVDLDGKNIRRDSDFSELYYRSLAD